MWALVVPEGVFVATEVTLSAYFAGGGAALRLNDDKAGLHLFRLEIDEGISCAYRGKALCWSEEYKEPAALLNANVSVSISHMLKGRDEAPFAVERALHGVVTRAAFMGAVLPSDGTHYYWYRITIESELAPARYAVRSRPFYYQSPVAVLTAVFQEYGITGGTLNARKCLSSEIHNFEDELSKQLLFDQENTSDWKFAASLLSLYGLTFTFTHPLTSGKQRSQAVLYVSSGLRYPAPACKVSGKVMADDFAPVLDRAAGYDTTTTFRLNSWSEDVRIGVNRVQVRARYPDGTPGSAAWSVGDAASPSVVVLGALPHGYLERALRDAVDKDVAMVLNAAKTRFDCEKSDCWGNAGNAAIMPGALVKIANDAGGASKAARVLFTHAIFQTAWKKDGGLLRGESDGEFVSVSFKALPHQSGSQNRYCCNPDMFEIGGAL
jgi:uncharacterized protein involved in type VI secretion and phage assembly